MLGMQRATTYRLIAVKLFLKYSNLHVCDHDTSTLRIDGRTNRRLAMAIQRSAQQRAVKSLALKYINKLTKCISVRYCNTVSTCINLLRCRMAVRKAPLELPSARRCRLVVVVVCIVG